MSRERPRHRPTEPCHRQSVSAYVDGCSCPGCREANAERDRAARNRARRAAGASEWCLLCDAVYHRPGDLMGHETRAHRSEAA
jgi:hypothetical protein